MDLSGVIFVLLAVAWAVYLIPKALKHHDEVARTRSIDRFSSKMRVLARREPVNEKDSRLVVTPARRHAVAAPTPTPEPERPARPAEPRESRVPAAEKSASRRTSTRMAARRRRRILGFLLLCVAGVGVAAYLAYLPTWAVAVPGGLTLAFLVLCRTQVRQETVAPRPGPGAAAGGRAESEQVAEQRHETPAPVAAPGVIEPVEVDFDDTEDTTGIPVARAAGSAGRHEQRAGRRQLLWDPLPVTLPTYVTAPKAHRTVRTIDLGQPGTWTSGRTAEAAKIAADAAAAEAADKGTDDGGQHAVGT